MLQVYLAPFEYVCYMRRGLEDYRLFSFQIQISRRIHFLYFLHDHYYVQNLLILDLKTQNNSLSLTDPVRFHFLQCFYSCIKLLRISPFKPLRVFSFRARHTFSFKPQGYKLNYTNIVSSTSFSFNKLFQLCFKERQTFPGLNNLTIV